MAKNFYIPANAKPDQFTDNVSLGDVVEYSFDFTAWQEDTNLLTTAVWTNEGGQASIASQVLADGVATALVTFSEAGRNIISIQANGATQRKKVWLEVYVNDRDTYADDYGIND